MTSRFASDKIAIAYCDVCGFEYKLKTLKPLVVNGQVTGLKACTTCWDPDHPQLQVGKYPVSDPQALRAPRPDTSLGASGKHSSRGIQWGWNPVGLGNDPYGLVPNDLVAEGAVGTVTVTTS